MIIQFENVQLKLDEILNDEFNHSEFNEIEFSVLKLICEWFSDQDTFVFKTSGSTGESKDIKLRRELIEYSANATFNFIDPDRNLSSSLLCLDPNFIGGAMVVFRALIMKHDLRIVKPSNNPLKELKDNERYGLVSMIPMQFLNSNTDNINQVSNLLIGGGHIDTIDNPNIWANVYATFGMTETVSHIALRKMDEDLYKTIGDTIVSSDSDSSLTIKGTLTGNQILKTNDIIECISETEFRWIGRKDFIINSGGVKLNPETIEKKLSNQFCIPFLISSLPNKLLGNKLILIVEGEIPSSIDYSILSKYEVPKQQFSLPEIPRTKSGKMDRIRSRKLVTDQLASLE